MPLCSPRELPLVVPSYLHTVRCPSLVPKAFPFSWGWGRAAWPSREGKSLGNEVEANPLLVINYHLRNPTRYPFKPGKNMSFTRKMCRTLTKRILTCLLKKGGFFSILVQNRLNSPKVAKKGLVFQKVARSCSLTKKLLKILKVARSIH